MSCGLCENAYGMSLCGCTYLICPECRDKLNSPNCPQCRSKMSIKLFLAGKATITCDNRYQRRLVINGNTESIKYNLRQDERGNLPIKDEDIIIYDDYISLEIELSYQEITPTTGLTGPYVIVDDKCEPEHGCFRDEDYADVTQIGDIVNERNLEAIKNCDVFVLRLNADYDCVKSLSEWGIALAYGKTLIILFPDKDEFKLEHEYYETKEHEGEYYLFAMESIKSLEKLPFTKREAIFTSHPILNFRYSDYKKKLRNIISKKHH